MLLPWNGVTSDLQLVAPWRDTLWRIWTGPGSNMRAHRTSCSRSKMTSARCQVWRNFAKLCLAEAWDVYSTPLVIHVKFPTLWPRSMFLHCPWVALPAAWLRTHRSVPVGLPVIEHEKMHVQSANVPVKTPLKPLHDISHCFLSLLFCFLIFILWVIASHGEARNAGQHLWIITRRQHWTQSGTSGQMRCGAGMSFLLSLFLH